MVFSASYLDDALVSQGLEDSGCEGAASTTMADGTLDA